MASYQPSNGQPSYYPQNNHPTSGQNVPYGTQSMYPPQSLQRTPSFDAGDDERYLDGEQDPRRGGVQRYTSYAPAPAGATSSVNRSQSASRQSSASMPFRTNTQIGALGGYQHQYQAPAAPTHAPYIPAQYHQQPQNTYNPQEIGRAHV